jgi:hypothetical protein
MADRAMARAHPLLCGLRMMKTPNRVKGIDVAGRRPKSTIAWSLLAAGVPLALSACAGDAPKPQVVATAPAADQGLLFASPIEVVDLGGVSAPPDAPADAASTCWPRDINNDGVVVGYCDASPVPYPGGATVYPFRYKDGEGISALPLPAAAGTFFPMAINDHGVAAGLGGPTLDYWNSDIKLDLGTGLFQQVLNAQGGARDINAAGQTVGTGYLSGGVGPGPQIFRMSTAGDVEVVGAVAGPGYAGWGQGYSVDSNGDLAGASMRSAGTFAATVYTGGAFYDLNNLIPAGRGWDLREAESIRDGVVVGYGTHDGHHRPFRYVLGGDITDLGFPASAPYADTDGWAIALDVNAKGHVVGAVYDQWPFWPATAFYYSDETGMVALNDLIDPSLGWNIILAFAINDNDQIVASAVRDGLHHAVELQMPAAAQCAAPVHSPASCPPPAGPPSGGGIIRYTLPSDGYVSLNIYDQNGAVVRELKRREHQAAGDHVLPWDGNDEQGQPVPADQPVTWKLLSNPGTLRAEYVMSLGSSYVRGDRSAFMAPGTHVAPGAVAVEGDDMYVAARETENIETDILKQPFDGSTRIWTALHPRAWDGAQALAATGGLLYMLGWTADAVSSQWVYRYRSASDATTAVFADGLPANGNGNYSTPAENHFDVSWDSLSSARADATDMDAEGAYLAVAYPPHDAVRWYAPDTGAALAEAPVPAPAGVTVAGDGTAYVSSGAAVVRIPVGGVAAPFATGLSAPGPLDIDHASNQLLVYDAGTAQVLRYDLGSGQRLATYGAVGGRRPGLYDQAAQTSFFHVVDVTADQQGGFFVAEENVAPRRVAHFDAAGALVREWYGGQKWSPNAMVDPDDPSVVWMHSSQNGSHDFMRLGVDYQGKTWNVHSTYTYAGLASGLVTWGDNAGADSYEIVKHAGKTYIAKLGASFTVLEWDPTTPTLRPVTVTGNIDALPRNADGTATPASALIAAHAAGNQSFAWRDQNGDGDVQVEELRYFPGRSPIAIIPAVDANGDYYGFSADPSSEDLVMLKYPADWSSGTPDYPSYPAGTPVFTSPARARGVRDPRWSAFTYHDRSQDDDTVYVGFNAQIAGNIGEAADPFLYKWNAGAAGSWAVGGKSRALGPAPPPGRIRGGFRRFSGMIARRLASPAGGRVKSVLLQDYQGHDYTLDQASALTYVWDEDGLWVGSVFDSVDPASPQFMYDGGGEFLQGQLHDVPGSDDVYYYGNWENETRVWRVSGWTGWTKQAGAVDRSAGAAPAAVAVTSGCTALTNGDADPGVAKGTDFGSRLVGDASPEHVFTITNTGGGDLNLIGSPPISLAGTNGGDFVVSTPPAKTNVPAGGSVTFGVRFIATAAGVRSGAAPNQPRVVIQTDAPADGTFSFAVKGTGVADASVLSFVTAASTAPPVDNPTTGLGGMSLSVGDHDILVTALGRWVTAGNQQPHTVFIYDAVTSQPLPGAAAVVQTIGVAPGQFAFGSLAQPITLAAHHAYYVVSLEAPPDQSCPHNPTYLAVTDAASMTGAVVAQYPIAGPPTFLNFQWESYGPVNFQYRLP